ncbi:MAG: DNA polymerase domain-containing protein [Candidatus Kariarchaeaceae archaeon]|jgi:DNA polymerase I
MSKSRKKKFYRKIKKKTYRIAQCWDPIPSVDQLREGLVLDGYYAEERKGFYCIIYDPEQEQLVKWLDKAITPTVRHLGNVPSSVSDLPVRKMKLQNLLYDEEVTVTEVPVDYTGIRYNSKVDYKRFPKVDQSASFELTYFQKRQLTPGTWVTIANNRLYKIGHKYKKKKIEEIKSNLLGEAEEIVELAIINMPQFDAPTGDVKRVAFDIEVKSPRGIFPLPELAEFVVHSIALYGSDKKAVQLIYGFGPTNKQKVEYTLNLGYEPEVISYATEKSMLIEFFTMIQLYPIVLSYSGDLFDLPYLHNRALKLGIKSPIQEGHFRGQLKEYHIQGTIHLDLYRFFNNNAVRLYAFGGKYVRTRLDDVADALLSEKKLEHDLWFDEMSIVDLVSYNIKDVELTLRLTTFNNNQVWNLMLMLMRVGKFTLTFANRESISRWILNWIAFEHRRRGAILPSRKQIVNAKGGFESEAEIEGKQYKGAIVLDPKPGTFWNVVVADFASLYPSVIKKFRLSYETLRCAHEECKYNGVPSLDHWVCTKKMGIASSLVGFIRDVRVRWYKNLAKKGTEEERVFADMIQAALKVFINAAYGVFGATGFALYCPPVAESVTAYSRMALMEAKKRSEEQGLDVLYGDTDSIFIHNPTEEQFNKIKIWSIVELGIELGVDYEFRFLVLSKKKKNYFGVTTDGKMIVKGLQIKKRNTAIIIKDAFEDIKQILVNVQDPIELEHAKKAMNAVLRKRVNQLKSGTVAIDKLASMATLNKEFNSYKGNAPALQIALQKMNAKNEGEIVRGTQFMVVKVKPFDIVVKTKKFKNFPLGKTVTCSVSEVSEVKDYSRINVDKYLELMHHAFEGILDSFQMDWQSLINNYGSLESYLDFDTSTPPPKFSTVKMNADEWNEPMRINE